MHHSQVPRVRLLCHDAADADSLDPAQSMDPQQDYPEQCPVLVQYDFGSEHDMRVVRFGVDAIENGIQIFRALN